ncbi:flavin reductase [Pseudoroseomonas wenyumeiae]|uniref:Flavin reductase n=1 Tax=Teichococcus wenyumeiae TaxID=2478470 RepID=A0A3A9J8D2_9PROT|nr:flavin reductase [Pseudoroseomonas wenyumeiae]RKK02280.1 flavin reductase [Pseudoroseomonas wenyumeiae]RMI20411.1 flavin reductase [Pseudoroseomonas wenyumeiae]
MPVTRQEFRQAMARLGAAVNVITSAGPGGLAGMTASAVCSVTDDPATILVCINRNSDNNAIIKKNGVLCVNVLSAGQQEVSDVFAGATGCTTEERFRTGIWEAMETGSPVLVDAAVVLDCVVDEVLEKGTHSVFFAHIVALRVSEPGSALMYWGRGYHALNATA